MSFICLYWKKLHIQIQNQYNFDDVQKPSCVTSSEGSLHGTSISSSGASKKFPDRGKRHLKPLNKRRNRSFLLISGKIVIFHMCLNLRFKK